MKFSTNNYTVMLMCKKIPCANLTGGMIDPQLLKEQNLKGMVGSSVKASDKWSKPKRCVGFIKKGTEKET